MKKIPEDIAPILDEIDNLWIVKASESLNAAKMLLDSGYPGFAVERAFFSIYYLASDLLGVKERAFTNHIATIATFRRKFGSRVDLARFVEYLADAEKARAVVEARRGRDVTIDEASFHIRRAEEFLKFAEERLMGDLE